MPAPDQMITEWQLSALSTKFAHHLDNAEFESLISLFTPDGVFDRGGAALRGHAEIREAMAERPPLTTRHLLTNHYFTEVGPDSARAIHTSVVFHGPVPENGEPVDYATENGRVLEFHDRYVRDEHGAWKFEERTVRPIFQPKVWP